MSERATGCAALALALGLVAMLLVAIGDDGTSAGRVQPVATAAGTGEVSGPTAAGADEAAASEHGLGGRSAGAATPHGASAASSATGSRTTASESVACTSPPGTDQGVTATEIKIAVILLNAAGPAVNSTFGIPSPDEQQEIYQDVIAAINASGGVACRKLTASFYSPNAFDQSALQQTCLDVRDAGVFFVIDIGAYATNPALASCYPRNHIPFLTYSLPSAQQATFYPYMFGQVRLETIYRNMVFALAQRGFFTPSNGFKALGVIYRTCEATLPAQVFDWLHQAGVPSSQLVTYDLGCPSAFASPSDLTQAVLKFQAQGVTHASYVNAVVDFANFTKVAQQQDFHPKYGLVEDGIVSLSYGNLRPDYDNLVDAIAITAGRWGEERTAGSVPTSATARCSDIFRAHGQPPVYEQSGGNGVGGIACNNLWVVAAAISHAPALQRSALAAGLQSARSVELSFPYGPNDYRGDRVTTGGQFWRAIQFHASCNCWQVIDPTFHPSM